MSSGLQADEGCCDPLFADSLTAYAFHDLSDDQRARVALHLVECDACWQEVRRLEASVRALRSDPSLAPIEPTPDVLGVLGLAGKLDGVFAGHGWFVVAIAALYGFLYAASVWTELGYSYDRFGGLAWRLSPIAGLWAAGTIFVALRIDSRLNAASRTSGLPVALGVAVLSLVALMMLLLFVLPAGRTIDAEFYARTAWTGYLKNVVYYFVPLLLFIIPPFDTVVRLQSELRAGRHEQVVRLVSGDRQAIAPRGLWRVPPAFLTFVLVVGAAVGFLGTNYMLDHLQPGPYASLYTSALYVRVGLWYVVALVSMWWYLRTLDELKREAHLAGRLLKP